MSLYSWMMKADAAMRSWADRIDAVNERQRPRTAPSSVDALPNTIDRGKALDLLSRLEREKRSLPPGDPRRAEREREIAALRGLMMNSGTSNLGADIRASHAELMGVLLGNMRSSNGGK